ncbi:MAG: hypothetical protein HQM03_09620 [Magnetococcales bacterium]|nr:hypothetical protein [Magnetococcales bacterium]
MRELHQESMTPITHEERMQRWLAIAKERFPEQLAAHLDPHPAHWVAITENGPPEDRQRFTAYLRDPLDLPYWAFVLAKSYLDDVGEWPLFGMFVEQALSQWEEHGDPLRAVREILAQVKPVWSDLDLIHVGEEATG